MDQRGAGQRGAGLARGVQQDPNVLLLMLDKEAGRIVAGQHLGREHFQRPAATRTVFDGLPDLLRVGAELLSQDHGFGDTEDAIHDEHLIAGLGHLAHSRAADENQVLSVGGQHRLGGFEIVGRAAAHDG